MSIRVRFTYKGFDIEVEAEEAGHVVIDVLEMLRSLRDVSQELAKFGVGNGAAASTATAASPSLSSHANEVAAALSSASDGGRLNYIDVFDVVKIRVDEVNGQKRYRVFGGRWGKFGVAAYPDSCQGLEHVPPGIGTFDTYGLRADAIMVNSKPVRIARIYPIDELPI